MHDWRTANFVYNVMKVGKGLNIAICDDEKFYIEKVKNGLEKCLSQQKITEYHIDIYKSGEALCENRERLKEYQIVFLDVNMQQMSGLEAAQEIRNVNKEVFLVFVTAYINYAVEGYKVDAIRFLLKDALEAALPECIDTILERMRYQEQKERFFFADGEREIPVHNICYIESEKHKLIFHIYEKDEIIDRILYGKLDELEKGLEEYGFIRIHKSYLVNVEKISLIRNYKVKLENGEELPVPREKFRQVKEKYLRMEARI